MASRRNLENHTKKITQTIGNGIVGITGLGGVCGIASYINYTHPDKNIIEAFAPAIVLGSPLFVIGTMSAIIAVNNILEMKEGNFNYTPIDYTGY